MCWYLNLNDQREMKRKLSESRIDTLLFDDYGSLTTSDEPKDYLSFMFDTIELELHKLSL
jgi:hypothetical protein